MISTIWSNLSTNLFVWSIIIRLYGNIPYENFSGTDFFMGKLVYCYAIKSSLI